MTRPLALTCGDPSGIGPEVAVKAWHALKDELTFFYIGDPRHLPDRTRFVEISDPQEAGDAMRHGLPVLPHVFPSDAPAGQPAEKNAQAIIDVIDRAVALAQDGHAGGICTLPINKKVLQDGAGFGFPGHTEYLAHLGGVKRVVMMLASPDLRVVPTTIHIPLADVPNALTKDLLTETIEITAKSLTKHFGIAKPRIAVAGLNPHAGEGGKMGHEDDQIIAPVIETFQAQGMDIQGPKPADTLFHARARAAYDVAICMYHDQALIPIKALDFDRGVNVTLGLPFIRTSPDHGTAFDIAGKGMANPSSTIEALRLAAQLNKR